ncbi:cadherin-23 isoform X2 [Aedes aegypti]|uniref:Cadherin-related family member 1 n=1 Tax=Aedes aegypti TaxID=7159 RepID=A0A6I8TES4_AEDAE|nr:cadherin-23 isoform X2 [Aedes aegypti]
MDSTSLNFTRNSCTPDFCKHATRKRKASSYKFRRVRLKWILSSVPCVAVLLLTFIPIVSCNRPPRFLIDGHSEIVLRLKEGPDTPVGSLIYKLKGYDPDEDPLTFGVRKAVDSDVIRVERSGVNEANVYLNKELDRETKDEYSLILTLSDGRLGEFSVTQSMLLLVEDINDNEPIFKPYTSAVEVSEDSKPGIIATVEATDRDEGAYGQVVYYLEELDGDNDVFTISTTYGKGIIRLVGSLDYERKSLYQLRVLAKDRANQGRTNTGTAALLVKVKDVEDQPPEFIVASTVIRVPEDAPIGTTVTQVKAIDGDRGVNNRIRYSISRNISSPFRIDGSLGTISTTMKLDREDARNRANAAYILEIVATEQNSKIKPTPSVRTEITIIITDVNDETPTFRSHSYESEINENAQENTPVSFLGFSRNEVFDYDQGHNGTFDLYLEPNNGLFEITPSRAVNEATFVLRVKDSTLLDYEKVKSMNFTIHAREIAPEGKHSMATIVVHIRDQNDNFPEFSKASYECYLPENSGVGALLTQIQAVDVDSGDFGTSGIRFISLSGSIADLLALNPLTGVITIKAPGGHALDRELVQKHYLTIEARDNLGRGNRNSVQLVVHILDVNDNAPVFLQSMYEARLMENKLSFETPLVLEARDADLNGTKNSEIKFEIVEGQFKDNFTIDAKSGKLVPLTPIDFELLTSGTFNIRPIFLTVLASDSGVPKLSTKVPVTIHVQDVNDHPPQFLHSVYTQSVPENLPSGSPILEVKAIDKDGSSPNNFIVYRIQSGASDKFVISPDTGIISVATGASLDPDMTDPKTTEYFLNVLALDGGIGEQQLQSFCRVNISIKDVNNKSPYFLEPGTISIRENTPVGTYAYRLLANDLDKEPILRYYMDSNTSEARSEEGALVKLSEYDYLTAFMLNSTDGLIRVIKLLDREKVEIIKLGFIVEDIAAEFGKQTATTTLTIVVEDENDNNPKFRNSFYKRSIPENSPHGVTIMSVVADDMDKNKTIRYSLEGPKEITELLHLDMETGEIVVSNKIDYEIFPWLNFTVRAIDSGHPPRSSLAEVFIQVIDENDNNPYFPIDTTNFTVYENSMIGTRIATIQALDPDSGAFGKITYLIDRVSASGKFSIDPDTGLLVVADFLDREKQDSYMIVIEAWDNYQFGYLSGESRNAFKQIFISVLDENDNAPIIQVPDGCVQVTEFHDIREPLLVLKATDADDPKTGNGLIGFDIIDVAGSDIFFLRQKERGVAEIFSSRSLNNFYGNYSLLIMARDEGSPPNTVNEKIDICVLDFNDHAPEFVSPSSNITIRIPENATVGTMIIQVMARDNDIGPNAAVRYRFKPDPLGSFRSFSIDEDTGSITLKLPLDRERQKVHELRVEAYDQGIPTPLSSDLDLTIYVRNVNDYEPQFLVEEISVNFTEHARPGLERRQLPDTIDRDEVDDLDDPPTMVCYFIVYGNENGHFHLDPHSHILTVTKELDRESRSNHTLVVKATEDCINTPPSINLSRPEAIALQKPTPFKYHQRTTKPTTAVASQYVSIYDRYKKSRSFDTPGTEIDIKQGAVSWQSDADSAPSSLLMPRFEKYTGQLFYHNDNTLVRVLIHVQDINDNPPVFIQKIFTGGVTTSTVFGTQFLKLTAIDRDHGANGQVSYYQIGDIKKTLTEGLENVQKPPFLVDRRTGAVQLNFDPQKGMKGYFDFKVLANDSAGHSDEAHVFIYLLREDQRVKFVLRLQPTEVREKIFTFRDVLSNVSSSIVNIDDFRIHENRDGSVDKTKTDLYLHLVNRQDNSILEVSDVLKIVDQNIEKLDELFKEFNVLDTQASEASFFVAELSGAPMLIWLFVSNLFIGALLIVVLGLCASQRASYRRQLRAARVANYAAHSDLVARGVMNSVPNTNKHSVEGSNPIWMKAYENEWFKNDDDLTKNISGPESMDDNVINSDDYVPKVYNTDRYDIVKQYNLYSQIDKLTNGNILTKKLETTEL